MKVNQTSNYNQLNQTPNFKGIFYMGVKKEIMPNITKIFGSEITSALEKLEKTHEKNNDFTAIIGVNPIKNTLSCKIISDSGYSDSPEFTMKAKNTKMAKHLVTTLGSVLDYLNLRVSQALISMDPLNTGKIKTDTETREYLAEMAIRKLNSITLEARRSKKLNLEA